MVDQVVSELGNAGIERPPCITSPFGRLHVMGKCVNLIKRVPVAGVLRAHHADGLIGVGAAARLEQWKEDGFLLLHVAQQFLLHLLKQRSQAGGHVRMLAVYGFHAARHAHQLRQLDTVNLMVATDDVVNQGCRFHVVGQYVWPLKGGELTHHIDEVKVLVQCCLPQADQTAAAEIQFQFSENARCAG